MPKMPRAPSPSSAAKQPGEKPASQPSPPALRIGSVDLSDGKIEFVDNAVEPAFVIETSRFQASLRSFDTAKPASDAEIELLLGLGKFGRLQVSGSAKPNLESLDAVLDIGFKNLELFKLNGYARPAIKHTIRQGRADGTIDLKLADGKIEAATSLTISRLKVTPDKAPKTAKGGSAAESGPPIETALGLLQDDKGIVRLSIPVSGSLEDPKFDLSDAIGQAVSGAMKETLLTAVKIAFPLGAVVAIIDSAGAAKVSIKPLAFAAGTAALTPPLKNRIGEIAAYLKKKPEENPSICGRATMQDLAALKKTNPKADRKAVLEIAARRISAVRDELVSTHSIPAKRFFICEPEFAEKPDAIPSVEVDLKS